MDKRIEDLHPGSVRRFLKEFKELMHQGQYFIKPRTVNNQTIINLGLTSKQVDDCIYSLTLQDYCSGPSQDEHGKGNLWVFGKKIDETELYIKLQIVTLKSGQDQAWCISFHKAERPLKYPYSQSKA